MSDREHGWEDNFRCPDVVVVLAGSPARDCGTPWCGGPDFLVEIVSPHDRSREKRAFYAAIGVKELLIVDRDPWQLELFQLQDEGLISVGTVSADSSGTLASRVLPVSFCLRPGTGRPQIELRQATSRRRWQV